METDAELRERIEELEGELADLRRSVSSDGKAGRGDVSRRRLLELGGLAGAGGLLALGSGATTRSASAQAAGSVGSPEQPVDVHAETAAIDGGLTGSLTGGETLTQLVGENLSVTDGRLDAPAGIDGDLADDLEEAVAELAMVSGGGNTWRFGPSEPTGGGHENPLWGIHFETDAETYLGETAVDSETPGWVTFAVYEYDGDRLGSLVDTRRVRTTAALQRVQLDFRLDPGEYLLTRLVPRSEDSDLWEDEREQLPSSIWSPHDTRGLPLTRLGSDYDWESESRNGVTFYGGDHPLYDANDYLYYFYDLQVATKQDP